MRLIWLAGDDRALLADHLWRTVTTGADRLGFLKFNHLAIIDIDTESAFNGVNVAPERI